MEAATTQPVQLDRGAPIPLYHQIFVTLRDDILAGRYAPGSALPTELEISARYAVSRITAKRALDEVAARGLVKRERGRGTIVVGRPTSAPLTAGLEGLLENILAMGLETGVSLLEFGYVPASEAVAAALQVPHGATVQQAVRVRSIAGLPFSFITTWVPEDIGRGYDRNDLSTQPLLILLERSGVTVSRAVQNIGAAAADSLVARELQIEPGSPLLRMERIVHGQDDRPVEFIRALYEPTRYQYRMELRRSAGEGPNIWQSVS